MGNFFSSILNFHGDKVHMNFLEAIMYGIIPLFGQMLMRIQKLGGSLDKPLLFFPLFLIPPFSFIPVILAKFGYIKKSHAPPPLDIYVVIPIIFRFIIAGIIAHFGISGLKGYALQAGILLGSIVVADLIHVYSADNCKGRIDNFGNRLIKSTMDGMLQYAAGIFASFIVMFIPFIGTMVRGIELTDGFMKKITDSLIWSVGFFAGYLLINMYDNALYNDSVCHEKISGLRTIVSIIAFMIAIGYQAKDYIFG